jgi:hypothetical protein
MPLGPIWATVNSFFSMVIQLCLFPTYPNLHYLVRANGQGIASTSELWTSAILEWLIKKYGSRSPSMASPTYQILWKYTKQFKYYWGWHTDWQSYRQAYDLTSLLSFLTKVGYKYFHGDETKFVPTTQNRMHDSRLPKSADSARHKHSWHNTLVCISCYQFPSSELNFKFYCIAQTANLHSQEWRAMAIMLLDICTQTDKARVQFRILHDV